MYLTPNIAMIHQRLPAWLPNATPAQRTLLKQRVLDSQRATRALRPALDEVQDIETFCRPLLAQALASAFPGQRLPDPSVARLRNLSDGHRTSWLEAALQNLDANAQVSLYASRYTLEPLALDGQRFVQTVRNLDLGQRYQDHLQDPIDTDTFRALLKEQDRAAFAAELILARLQGAIDSRGERLGEALLAGVHDIPYPDGSVRRLECSYLSLFDVPLSGLLVLRLHAEAGTEPCVLYSPGDPQSVMRQYASLQHLGQALTQRLWQPDYRAFFSRFIAQAQQATLVARLRTALYPSYPYDTLHSEPPVLEKGERFSWLRLAFPPVDGLWQETLDKNARLPWRLTPWPQDAFAARARLHVQRNLSDAATLAVPVAQHDAAERLAHLEAWLGLGLTIANVAALFVPVLGEVMMVVGGAQLVDEFLDGVHAANQQDANAAVDHLFDVLIGLAQIAGLGAAAGYIEAPGPLHDWHLTSNTAHPRLWNGDLAPFAHATPLPGSSAPHANGLFDWQGQHWIEIDGHAHAVVADADGSLYLRGSQQHRHAPRLQGHPRSAWLLDHERPLAWDSMTLLERLTPAAADLDATTLERALRSSGLNEHALRALVVDHQPPPALLLDSLQAYGATRFTQAPAPLPGDALLARDFPGLSARARAEVLEQASPADLGRASRGDRLPLALAESARYHLREGRITRALAAFHGAGVGSDDRDLLALANLEHLPGWPGETAVTLRQDSPRGTAIATLGDAQAPLKTLVRRENGYQPYDEQGQALGIEIHQGERLRDALFAQAAGSRERTAVQLRMAPIRPLYRLPTRTLADARLGYRLSGRASGQPSEDELFDTLYPNHAANDRQLLRERLRQEAGDQPGAFAQLLHTLHADYRQLDADLERWITAATDPGPQRAARTIAAQRLRQAWRMESAGDPLGSPDHVSLELHGEHLGTLPILPVRLVQVRQLSLTGLPVHAASSNLGAFLEAFPHLRFLDLGDNRLVALPATLGNLTELESLDLADNLLDLTQASELDTLTGLSRLTRLNLTNTSYLSVDTFERLASLPALRAFQADLNALELTEAHFQALERWPALRSLSLGNNEISLTEASRSALARLTGLHGLYLQDNPLGLAPDLTGWNELQTLDLENCELTEWPTGLEALMRQDPLVLQDVDLSDNALTDAPDLAGSTFASGVNDSLDVHLNLNGNPFSEQAASRLTAAFDGWVEAPSEDVAHGWRADWPEDLQAHITLTATEPEWQALYDLFDRLPDTSEYRLHGQVMRTRMQHVLRTLVPLEGERPGGGWGLADLHQRINARLEEAAQACVDQASLLFQEVETDVMVWHTVANASAEAQDSAVAVDTLRALLHQQLLDQRVGELYDARVARRRALNDPVETPAPALQPDDDIDDVSLGEPGYLLDELEIALVARMRLRQRLGLPQQPEVIAFGQLARLSDATLERLAVAVLDQASAERLAEWAVEQPFWRAWVRRLQPQPFADLVRAWDGASEYYTELSVARTEPGAYTGPAVPDAYVEALERDIDEVDWRENGVLQRIDLVSDRYANESALYQRAADLLLSTRQGAEAALLRQLTEEIIQQQTG